MYPSLKSFLVFFFSIFFTSYYSFAQNTQSLICSVDSVLISTPECNSQCTGAIEVFAQGTGTLFYQWIGLPGANTSLVTGLCAGSYVVIITDSTGCIDSSTVMVDQPAPIGFNLAINNSTCPGGCTGSVTVIPLDTLSYTYQWPGYLATGPGLNTLCPGTYTVIMTNPSGCSVIGSAQVGYDPPFDLSFTTIPASCLNSCDGYATVFANGIQPFTYQWGTGPIQITQGAIGLCSGNISVSVTDSTGCVVTDSVSVPINAQPSLSFNVIPPDCFGGCNGEAHASVTGSGNFTYQWNTFPIQDSSSAFGLCSGVYILEVTNLVNGCVLYDSILVNNPPPAWLSFTTTKSLCDNICTGSATVTSSGPSPLLYLWQTGAATQTADSLCPGIYSVTVTDSIGCVSSASVTILPQELLFSVTDADCNNSCDGVAQVYLPAPFGWQVIWNVNPVQNTPVATQLCSGIYSVLLFDTAGCQLTGMVEVEELQPVVLSYNFVPVTCPGDCDGEIQLNISGNDPFTIQWNTIPGQTNDTVSQLCSGYYPVTVTDSVGCSINDTLNIPDPVIPLFSYSTISNTCYNFCDASAVINPLLPGTYTYAWQTNPIQYGSSVAGLCPFFTVVEITSSQGCTYLDSVLIIGTYDINIGISTVNPSCNSSCDGFASSQVFGGTPLYNYAWSNGLLTPQALNLCEGTYTLTVTDSNGCMDSGTITLTAPAPLAITFTVIDASCITCSDGMVSALVTGGTPGYNYYWSPGGLGNAMIDSLSPGIYNLCIADDNLCIYCADAEVLFTDALNEVSLLQNNVSVFPNPFSGFTTIKLSADAGEVSLSGIKIYDVLGRETDLFKIGEVSGKTKSREFSVDASNVSSGLYIFKITSHNNQIISGRFVVQH